MNKSAYISKLGLLVAMFAFMMTACNDSVVYDDEGDCSVHYRVKFKYDKNLKFADAFNSEVKSVALYVFDEAGSLVYTGIDSGEALQDEEYAMPVELFPGTYEMLAWCGLGNGESFTVPQAVPGVTTKEELKCYMNREYTAMGTAYVDKDLNALYHGEGTFTFDDEPGIHYGTINLTKNTNNVRVILQQLSGKDVKPEDFTFEIQDYNGYLAHDNSLIQDELVVYRPWSISTGSADINADVNDSRAATNVNVALAELTTNRLVMGQRPILVVRNAKEDKIVLSIPLIDYALLIKGHYNSAMSDQEYLDRQDEYNMTFFLDESGDWASSFVIINSWRVVLNNTDFN